MHLNIGTIAGVIHRSERILDQLRGGTTSQTIAKLKQIAVDPHEAAKLLLDLDALEQHLRVLKLVELEIK